MSKPLTQYEVREIVILGPRWGETHAWIVQDGPGRYYKQLAGPFSSRKEALEELAYLVNQVAAGESA